MLKSLNIPCSEKGMDTEENSVRPNSFIDLASMKTKVWNRPVSIFSSMIIMGHSNTPRFMLSLKVKQECQYRNLHPRDYYHQPEGSSQICFHKCYSAQHHSTRLCLFLRRHQLLLPTRRLYILSGNIINYIIFKNCIHVSILFAIISIVIDCRQLNGCPRK